MLKLLKLNKIKRLYCTLFLIITVVTSTNAIAKQNISSNYYNTLSEYINLPENLDTNLKFLEQSIDTETKVTKKEYILNSQIWPKQGDVSERRVWQHRVTIYIPSKLEKDTALVWINGGTKYPLANKPDYIPDFDDYPLDFTRIAAKSKAIVIDLKDIPNQYITLNGKKYAEDGLIAHTWSKFIEDPEHNKYLPAYLPMVKATTTTMDNIEKSFKIKKFVVSGLSKRGMTTWLTALHDNRVKAIIPVAIDVLNFESIIQHIHHSLNEWPIALHDYYEQNVLQQLNSKNSKYLMQISDPLKYITCENCETAIKQQYKNRAEIDKFIIAASGDDFFTPDSSMFYLDYLPGKTYIRYIPNSRHYIDNKIVSKAVFNYFYNYTNEKSLPKFSSKVQKDITSKNDYIVYINTSKKPSKIKVYSAYNPKQRDFRLAYGNKYSTKEVTNNSFNKYHFKKTGEYRYAIIISKPDAGWLASFVEVEYDKQENDVPKLKLTTPVHVLPKKYPLIERAKQKAKQIVQYGKKVIYN